MKEYTKKQVDEMREALASRSIDYWDEETIYDIAMDGCVGYKNMPDEDWEYTMNGVLGSVHKSMKAAIPIMKKQNSGKILIKLSLPNHL